VKFWRNFHGAFMELREFHKKLSFRLREALKKHYVILPRAFMKLFEDFEGAFEERS
jgi:hypothetical protein